jgi:DNA polymerase theta
MYIAKRHVRVVKLVTGLTDQGVRTLQDRPLKFGGMGRIDPELDSKLDRIWAAAVMKELVNERPISEITRKFGIDRGVLQGMQMQCAAYAAQVGKFCELIGSGLLATTVNKFRHRLNFASKAELLGLLVLPSMTRDLARKLVDCGIEAPPALAALSMADMLAIGGDGLAEEAAQAILQEAIGYAENLARIEGMEETAILNAS